MLTVLVARQNRIKNGIKNEWQPRTLKDRANSLVMFCLFFAKDISPKVKQFAKPVNFPCFSVAFLSFKYTTCDKNWQHLVNSCYEAISASLCIKWNNNVIYAV